VIGIFGLLHLPDALVIAEERVNRRRQLDARFKRDTGHGQSAALAAAHRVAERPAMADKHIVVIIPSCGERYLSTALFEGIA